MLQRATNFATRSSPGTGGALRRRLRHAAGVQGRACDSRHRRLDAGRDPGRDGRRMAGRISRDLRGPYSTPHGGDATSRHRRHAPAAPAPRSRPSRAHLWSPAREPEPLEGRATSYSPGTPRCGTGRAPRRPAPAAADSRPTAAHAAWASSSTAIQDPRLPPANTWSGTSAGGSAAPSGLVAQSNLKATRVDSAGSEHAAAGVVSASLAVAIPADPRAPLPTAECMADATAGSAAERALLMYLAGCEQDEAGAHQEPLAGLCAALRRVRVLGRIGRPQGTRSSSAWGLESGPLGPGEWLIAAR